MTPLPKMGRLYGIHLGCGGAVSGAPTGDDISVSCAKCGDQGFATFLGKVRNRDTGATVNVLTAATVQWLDLHDGCSGEIYLHEFTLAGNTHPAQVRRILRCRTHQMGFRIEVGA